MLLLYSDKDGVRAPRFHCYELHLKKQHSRICIIAHCHLFYSFSKKE